MTDNVLQKRASYIDCDDESYLTIFALKIAKDVRKELFLKT